LRFAAGQVERLPAELKEIERLLGTDVVAGRERLADLVGHSRRGRWLLTPATVVLVGPPNAGKSTLFNALARRTHALVSDVSGTTRDWVDVEIAIEGVPIRLVDTAGIGRADDEIESRAVERSIAMAGESDVVLVVLDGSSRLADGFWEQVVGAVSSGSATIVVLNKSDLPGATLVGDVRGLSSCGTVVISALTGDGLAGLGEAILDSLGMVGFSDDRPAFATRRMLRRGEEMLSDVDRAIGAGRSPTIAKFLVSITREAWSSGV
jgi:tRNA modification GTPase